MTPKSVHPGFSVPSHPFSLSFHPEEQLLAVSTVTGHVYFGAFDLENGEEPVQLHRYKAHSVSARVVQFNRQGTFLSAGADGRVLISDLNPKKIWQSAENPVPINCATFFPGPETSSVLLTGDDEGICKIFDSRVGKNHTQIFHEQTDYITSLLPLPESHRFLATSGDATVAVFDIRKSGKDSLVAISDPQDHEIACSAVLSAPVSRTASGVASGAVLTGDSAGVIGVWKKNHYGDVRDRVTLLADSMEAAGGIEHMLSISDCRILVASEGMLRCLQLYPHAEEGVVGIHDQEIEALAMDADLGVVAAADSEGKVKFWKLPGKTAKNGLTTGRDKNATKPAIGRGTVTGNKKLLEKKLFFDDLSE